MDALAPQSDGQRQPETWPLEGRVLVYRNREY